ncbi:MAG TPA: [FeFe] hydrogenase H-cluster maturation GTPase HydF [Bacteroidales bacterium]|nr:[FeFe] hydrogenase H-cluster maturation GTPase HydF [Bacteroidales bacterium]HNZ42845.1 [FeFe] hydrogenase H-cluster maturation GTPase HydF [Bacteroidales bacterium]HPB24488.1 [FeFe] hydrogenase H-cluster maturation GTPase HydF [Bacteroidales bacterium]HPI30548.1 [FeFe] hydrogenase H-cluster maturation GTPase HydF [Bacteroidales bacterium]HQN15027.1 [FeFe] hydrogenase H-cluster maturation GTPase HydF [Bacteroidales bacterium]
MSKGRDLKPQIGIFGRRNNGKSSLINLLVGQEVAIVSEQPGTTTDPVRKSIEIFGIGPVIMVDTAGIDDAGSLGSKRIEKSLQVIKTIDCAVLVITENFFGQPEVKLIEDFNRYNIPFIVVHNKSDLQALSAATRELVQKYTKQDIIEFSTLKPDNLEVLVSALKNAIPESAYLSRSLVGDIINEGDYVLLVTPIDSEAPEGRMILPQQMAIRDVLDNNCVCIVLKETELQHFFKTSCIKPVLVITDSQVFGTVKELVPEDIPLTSFSIIFSRLKGDFENYVNGTQTISSLNDGDRILILESCTHHVSCDDIGRVKIPMWLSKFTGKKLYFSNVSGLDALPENFKDYKLVIQCGGCMVTRKQILNRLKPFTENSVSITNYGMAIAFMNGIFTRALQPFFKTLDHSLSQNPEK